MTPPLKAGLKSGPATALRLRLKTALILLPALALSGCATLGNVQPWEKGTLARPDMSFNDAGSIRRFDEHIYTSREASSGGAGVGGGGCGCN